MKKALLNIVLVFVALLGVGRVWGQPADRTVLLKFMHAPFPLAGSADDQRPFFTVNENGRRGHNSPRGGVYWEDATYSDNSVLLSLSPNFNPSSQPMIVVYFHGNQSRLERDLINRHQLPAQFAMAGLNALLVAPQFAFDALDSSSGRFAEPDFFAKFLKEVAEQVALWQEDAKYRPALEKAPVVLVAYSGGYLPASNVLELGGAGDRLAGLVLLDALYGNEDKFAAWIKSRPHEHFFFSAYTGSTRSNNETLQNMLRDNCIEYSTTLPDALGKGQVGFLDLGDELDHYELPAHAWSDAPFGDIMAWINDRPRARDKSRPAAAKRKGAARTKAACVRK